MRASSATARAHRRTDRNGRRAGWQLLPGGAAQADAVDVVRIDLTCMGGITGGRRVIDRCVDAGVDFAPHMFAHVHSQVFAALGFTGVPIEWGRTVDRRRPLADSLAQPVIANGMMAPLPEQPGFGSLLDVGWATSQPHDDPHRIFDSFQQKGDIVNIQRTNDFSRRRFLDPIRRASASDSAPSG